MSFVQQMNDRLDTYIGNVKQLPTAPTVLVKLLALFREEDRDVDEIVGVMRQDPALTVEVLRHSNSAYFGHEEPILDVFEAIMRLGFYEVYQIAVARLGSQALTLPKGKCNIDVNALWRHSLASAVTTGLIAKRVNEHEGLAFTAGLLHDVGKIVLASAEGPAYGAMVTDLPKGGAVLQETEFKTFGFGHSEIGARLLTRWGLPNEISIPVQHHHRGSDWGAPFERLCAIVSLGNFAAHLVDAAPEKSGAEMSPEAANSLRLVGLEENDLTSLLLEAQKDIQRLTSSLGVASN